MYVCPNCNKKVANKNYKDHEENKTLEDIKCGGVVGKTKCLNNLSHYQKQ